MVVGGKLSSAYYEGISQTAFFDSLTPTLQPSHGHGRMH